MSKTFKDKAREIRNYVARDAQESGSGFHGKSAKAKRTQTKVLLKTHYEEYEEYEDIYQQE